MSATIADGVVFTVEIGFSTSAGSGTVPINSTLASITWTDVSAYVRSVSTNRGRSSELDSFQAGSASITLSNADRRFDPEHASGPYFGSLTPLRPIRIRAQYGAGATTNLFFGWIDQWPQSYNNPTDATVTITASDAFKVLNLLSLPSYWEYAVRSRLIAAYWLRMDETTGASSLFDSLQLIKAGDYKTPAGSATTAVSGSSLVANDSNASAVFDGTRTVSIPSESILAGSIVSLWIQTSTTTTGSYGIYTFFGGSGVYPSCIGMDVAAGVGTIRISYTRTQFGAFPGITSTVLSSVVVNDGKPHHIMFGNDIVSGGGIDLYVDGVRATTTGSGADWTDSVTREQFGIARTFAINTTLSSGIDFTSNFVGTIDEIVGYAISLGSPIVATDVSTNYAIGKGTFGAGDRTDTRISSVLAMARWMSDGADLATGSATVQAIATEGKTPLSLAQECETAEQGRLFIDRDGKVDFISRDALATTSTYNTSQYTFGDSTGELGYTDLRFEFDDRLIFNRSVIGRRDGVTTTVDDTTSQGQFFIRTTGVSDLIVNTDQRTVDIANARIAAYAQPKLRIEQLAFTPRQAATSLYPVAIGVEIGTRITVNRRPQSVGSVISQQVIVEGISHTITADTWQTTFQLSPVFASTFILNSATLGVLNTNQLGY